MVMTYEEKMCSGNSWPLRVDDLINRVLLYERKQKRESSTRQPRSQGFSLGNWPIPISKGKTLGTRLGTRSVQLPY